MIFVSLIVSVHFLMELSATSIHLQLQMKFAQLSWKLLGCDLSLELCSHWQQLKCRCSFSRESDNHEPNEDFVIYGCGIYNMKITTRFNLFTTFLVKYPLGVNV